jgi:DNA-binding CsgD family transcriptional regulator
MARLDTRAPRCHQETANRKRGGNVDESEWVSHLTGEIYDASLDPELWTQVLEATCQFLDGLLTSLGSFDLVRADLNVTKYWGFDAESLQVFNERYARTHPLIPATMRTRAGDVVTIGEMMPYEEFYQTAVYREFLKNYGYIDAIQATLEHTATAVALFGVARHESVGMVDDTMRRRMGLLAPHMRRAVLIGKVVQLHRFEPAALADTLDGLAAGVFLVDADLRIVHANASGGAMLTDGDVVRPIRQQLAVQDQQADRTLKDIVAAAERGDDAVGTGGIAVPFRSTGGKPFVAHVLPLTSGARRQAGTRYSAVAAVFVREASIEGSMPLDMMARHYALTPAETRVLFGILSIGSVPEVARVLGVSDTTVKTHLQHLFDKTGTNRQPDLVKLAAGFASPLGGPPAA